MVHTIQLELSQKRSWFCHYDHTPMNTALSKHTSSLWTRHYLSTCLHYEHGAINPHVFTMNTALSIHISSLWPHSHEHGTIHPYIFTITRLPRTRHCPSICLHYDHTPMNMALFTHFFTMNMTLSIHVFTMKRALSIHTSSQCTQQYLGIHYKHGTIHPYIFTINTALSIPMSL